MRHLLIRILIGIVFLTLILGGVLWWMNQSDFSYPMSDKERRIYKQTRKLKNLHTGLGPVKSGDWLENNLELGQTFNQYANNRHIELTKERGKLYVLPLGEFDENQKKIVELSAEFLGVYYACEVELLETIGLDAIPQQARRVHPSWGVRQINSQHVLHQTLPPLVADDAFALIAFTSSDLFPDESYNFVFGQASPTGRVGVWSLFRNGDPKVEFEKVLRRTLKTASHETGHMFTIYHCVAYDCNMCGCNSLEEADRRPLYMCPECLGKVILATGCEPVQRFESLRSFCQRNGLQEDADFYNRCIQKLK